jgi:hypothetical protein
MKTLDENLSYSRDYEETFRDKYGDGLSSELVEEVTKLEKHYSTFAEQFLDTPVMEEGYSPIRAMGSWLIPTFCTWKLLPVLDDCDDL